MNPATSVRGPKHVVTKGATAVLTPAETRALLDRIDTGTLVGLRDRALLSVMVFGFARVTHYLVRGDARGVRRRQRPRGHAGATLPERGPCGAAERSAAGAARRPGDDRAGPRGRRSGPWSLRGPDRERADAGGLRAGGESRRVSAGRPKHVVTKGTTPVLTPAETREPRGTLVGCATARF